MHPRNSSPARARWLWIAAIWLALALIASVQQVTSLRSEGINRPLTLFFIANTLSWVPWALATPLIMRLARRFPPGSMGVRGWSFHLAACLATNLVHSGWITALQVLLNPWGAPPSRRPFFATVGNRSLSEFFLDLIVYGGVVAVAFTIESRRRLAQREVELSQAQLDALRRQLEPHFLFNTLNAISALVRDQRNHAAVEMIAGLSDLLRRVVHEGGRQQVPLAEELEFLERYLDIQRIRFTGRLRVTVEVPQQLYTAQVPSLILQPIVENAIQHGIGKLVEGGAIRIRASADRDALALSVYNDGPSLPSEWSLDGAGVGLGNTRARIESLYGPDCSFTLRNHQSGGVEAVVTLPYRTAPL